MRTRLSVISEKIASPFHLVRSLRPIEGSRTCASAMNAPLVTSPTVTTSTAATRGRVAPSVTAMTTATRITRPTETPARRFISTRLTLMTVLRPELLGECHRFEERRNSLDGTIRHVRNRLATPTHGFDVDALRYEILNELIITARGGVMQRVVAVQIAKVRIELQLFDQILHSGKPRIRRVHVRVRRVALAVADTRRRVNRVDTRAAD